MVSGRQNHPAASSGRLIRILAANSGRRICIRAAVVSKERPRRTDPVRRSLLGITRTVLRSNSGNSSKRSSCRLTQQPAAAPSP